MRQVFRRVVIAIAFITVSGVVFNAACPNAEASFGVNDALETMGIAAGIGAVIGASTIAFYESPGQHWGNALVGAGAGLVVGLGVVAYLMANASEDDEISPEELLPPENKPTGKPFDKEPAKQEKKNKGSSLRPKHSTLLAMASVPATLATRGSSNWMVAVRVLELRF